eukprot:gnl/TRDRNA2_/TRDRNA2_166432_c5_seq5.p1 gnl/TRDRNA2_/TRDRNA2_166432_c5~~gnl/TRDRNA2_/TRDRNA2_166432_c5_seq5.p1  ORF type:complete len:494 (+),score=112.01 gnl/TRDRNA2_/TRDRNA2_166432_c5_seq5:661-2142(+)
MLSPVKEEVESPAPTSVEVPSKPSVASAVAPTIAPSVQASVAPVPDLTSGTVPAESTAISPPAPAAESTAAAKEDQSTNVTPVPVSAEPAAIPSTAYVAEPIAAAKGSQGVESAAIPPPATAAEPVPSLATEPSGEPATSGAPVPAQSSTMLGKELAAVPAAKAEKPLEKPPPASEEPADVRGTRAPAESPFEKSDKAKAPPKDSPTESRALGVLAAAASDLDGMDASSGSRDPTARTPWNKKQSTGGSTGPANAGRTVMVGAGFVRNTPENLDHLSEAERQAAVTEIEQQRQLQVQELVRRQRKHSTKVQKAQRLEARRLQSGMSEQEFLEDEKRRAKVKELKRRIKEQESVAGRRDEGQQPAPPNASMAATMPMPSATRVLHRHVHHHVHYHEGVRSTVNHQIISKGGAKMLPALGGGYSSSPGGYGQPAIMSQSSSSVDIAHGPHLAPPKAGAQFHKSASAGQLQRGHLAPSRVGPGGALSSAGSMEDNL